MPEPPLGVTVRTYVDPMLHFDPGATTDQHLALLGQELTQLDSEFGPILLRQLQAVAAVPVSEKSKRQLRESVVSEVLALWETKTSRVQADS